MHKWFGLLILGTTLAACGDDNVAASPVPQPDAGGDGHPGAAADAAADVKNDVPSDAAHE